MSYNASDGILIKRPHQKMSYTEQQIVEFAKCMDPVTGPEYFMTNFFFIQHPTKGQIKYEPFEYQKRLIDVYHKYRHSISMLPRQCGKTTSAAGYLLWYAMFVPDSTILIAAHKYLGAQEIMQRIRYAYEACPNHIRAGVVSYNKGSIEFENGSRIVAQATTENTGRGMSISLLYLDEFAFVRPTIATEFWTAITPTLSTGGKALITSTPNSDEDQFALIWKGANKTEDEFGNKTEVGKNGFKAYQAHWSEHPERDEKWAAEQRAQLGDEKFEREIECIAGDSKIQIKLPSGEIKLVTMLELQQLLPDNHKSTEAKEELRGGNYLIKNNKNIQVLTDNGWSAFDGLAVKGQSPIILVSDELGHQLKCSPTHQIYLSNGLTVSAQSLKPGQKIATIRGPARVVSINLSDAELVYDLVNVEKNTRFYANNMLVSNCKFIRAEETLISPMTLAHMEGVEPIERQGQVRWFQKPKKGKIYCVSLDPSLGTGGDAAAIQVFEANSTTQVAEWKHNKTPIPAQIKVFTDIIKQIHSITNEPMNIYYSVENNSIGEAALISLEDYGEENIPGIFLSEPKRAGSGRRYRKGFTTTHGTKLSACAKMKTLIENKKMSIYSQPLISEFKNFVASGNSYAAKLGETDDLVMATVLIVRMLQLLQNYHKELSDQIRDHSDEVIEPMPFVVVF